MNYNFGMFEIINIIVVSFLSDLMILFLLKRVLMLSVGKWELCFIQIIPLAPTFVFVLCQTGLLVFIGLKMLAAMLVCVLITDSFKFGFISKLYFLYVVLMFSIYGFAEFEILLVESVFENLFGMQMQSMYYGLCVIGLWVYVALIYLLMCKLTKINKLRQHIAHVSFSLFGKHIEVVGLIDSGNSLMDNVTNKPVVVISVHALKKHFKDFWGVDMHSNALCQHFVDCVVAGGKKFQMPIFDIGSVCVKRGVEIKSFDCVLGFVTQKFYDEKDYQCLIHRNCF